MSRPRVVVVGAGIAGLAAAHRLTTTTDAEVLVIEAADRVGGVALTEHLAGALLEWGPEAVPASADVRALFAELGLELVPGAPARGSLLWLKGRLRPLPVRLANGAVPATADALALVRNGVLPPAALLRMAAEPLMARRPRPSGTLADTYEHLLGRSATQRLVAPFAEGVFGGSTDVLADTVVPRPVEGSLVLASLLRSVRRKEPESGPPATDGLLAVAGGMGRLVEVLSGRLEVAVGEPVVGLDRHPNGTIGVRTEQRALSADAVVVAAPPPATAGLVRDVAPPAATALAHVVCGSSAIIHVEVAPEHQERLAALGASGWLGAPEERPAVAAGSFVGLKWPHLGCPGRVRASVRREDLLAGGDDRLMRVALDEIEAVLGVPLLREGTRLHRWDRALPLRTPDAAAQVARARAALPGDVVLVGTAEGGSGVASALMSGRRGADRLGLSPKATDRRPSGWTSGQRAAHS